MANMLQEYIKLKCFAIDLLDQDNEAVKNVLKHYAKEINSNRVMEMITSGLNLIRILEKRNCLSPINIEPLNTICNNIIGLNSNVFKNSLNLYKSNLENGNKPSEPDYYSLTRRPILQESIQCETSNVNNSPLNILDDKIYEAIGESIGTSWRTMARYLDIKEGIIDRLDEQYRANTLLIVTEVLKICQKKYPKNWMRRLCKALEQSRRLDLKKEVEDIIHESDKNC